MIQVKGSYTIKTNTGKILVQRNNLITYMGELFFMNRAVNNEFDPISYILLGNSPFRVAKSDMSLGNETFKKKAIVEVDGNQMQIRLTCSCTLSEIINTCEIGTSNGTVLISHDSYNKITSEDVGDNVDSVEITYIFDFSTSATRSGWLYYSQADTQSTQYNIYYIVEESNVTAVSDDTNGYHIVDSLESLKSSMGAFYYDNFSKNLYVRTINGDDPNNLSINITTE